ncbi:hypothetical protein [Lonepinella sp. MS14437]|uniref:Nmad2 family putative nucleotide modification protein n=1 Tax=Lonepinella sp. MS14437 TaxID=3003620 RepID=UPI0036D9FAA8
MFNLNKNMNPTFYTYKVAYDHGTAPNPDQYYCSLAICKPVIRRTAKVGDLIVGFDTRENSNRIVYIMIVDEVISWHDYIIRCETDPLLKNKIPRYENDYNGDCIWKIESFGISHQPLKSRSGHGINCYHTDVEKGKNVLLGKKFMYFGNGENIDLRIPEKFHRIIPNRGHKSKANIPYLEPFIEFINKELELRGLQEFKFYGNPKLPLEPKNWE